MKNSTTPFGIILAIVAMMLPMSAMADGPAFAPEPLTPLADAPTASLWDGPYLGIGIGATQGDFTFDYAYDRTYTETGNHKLGDTTYGGFIGYAHTFDKFYLAAEIGGDVYNVFAKQDYHGKCVLGASGLEYVVTAALRAGYLVTPELLAYVHGGAAWANASASVGWQSNNKTYPQHRVEDTLQGYVMGAGLEYAISEHGRIRLEYSQYTFDDLDTGKFIGSNSRANFDHSNIQVQLAWQF